MEALPQGTHSKPSLLVPWTLVLGRSVHSLRMFICEPIHSFMPVLPSSPVLTQTEFRPCLQVAFDLSWDVRHPQPLLEVSLSPSRQSGCLSVVFILGTCPLLCSCLLMGHPKTTSQGERLISSSMCSQASIGNGASHSSLCSQFR